VKSRELEIKESQRHRVTLFKYEFISK